MQTQNEVKGSFKLLLLASAVTLVLWFIPLAGVVTYPIRMFVTFIHEAGHALAAMVTFGEVRSITLDWNESGLTYTRGGWRLLISSAGYLSTILYGSGLLLLLRSARTARLVAIASGIAMLAVTVAFGGNLLAWLVGLLFGCGLVFMAIKAKPGVVHFAMSFLAVQSLLNAFYHLRALMYLSAFDPSIPTDAANMSEATGGWLPPIVWAVAWSLVSAATVAGTLLVYYRSLRLQAATIQSPSAIFLTDGTIASKPRL